MSDLLSADAIVAGYGAHDEILKGLSLNVHPSEIVAILGPNGAGKSTMLKAIAGVVRPRSGRVMLNDTEITGLKPREAARFGVAFVPQEANIFPSMTILENLEIGGYVDRRAYRTRLDQVFERMPELVDKRRARAGSLSGGQRQLLAMGMALMVGPKLLLLDEPTAGLSPAAAEKLFATVRSIANDGVGVALVEQNALHAMEISDRAFILVDGRNNRSGPSSELIADPDIRRVFLGE